MKPKDILKYKKTLIASLAGGFGTYLYRKGREKRHESIQKRVNDSAPQSPKIIAKVNKSIDAPPPIRLNVVVQKEEVDLTPYEKIDLNPQEANNNWKNFLLYGGKIIEKQLTTSTFTGLVKCDIPLNKLCRVVNNFEARRGYVLENGKFAQHASLSEPGISKTAPLLVYQYVATVTSQYYHQIITERLDTICKQLDTIINFWETEDYSKLSIACQRLIELNTKSSYDMSDKDEASRFSEYAARIRSKYEDYLTPTLAKLKVTSQWNNKKEAEQKVQLLNEAHYFTNIKMALCADAIEFVSNLVLIKIAHYLGNNEDKSRYMRRINLNFWNHNVNYFNRIKHDVLKYLELQSRDTWLEQHKKDILRMMSEQTKQFNDVEEMAKHFQESFNCNTPLYM